jgi:transposase
MAAIAVTQSDLTAMELRVAAGREKNSAASRRMLALAMVFDGADRTSAAETCGMDRQTLRDWVHRYNATGLAGLRNRKSSGRPPKLTAAQKAVLVELVEKGPDPARHKVVRWRRCDLAGELERLFGVKLHERSVGDLLASLGYRRLSVRPQHPQADEAAQEAFKKTSPQRSQQNSPIIPKESRSKSGSRTRRALASKAR